MPSKRSPKSASPLKPGDPKEASSRGGKAKTAAKLDALARLHSLKRELGKQRIAALKVPAPFDDVHDFLGTLREFVGRFPIVPGVEMAQFVGVASSTISKYIRCKVIPTQEKLDLLIAWWKSKRASHPDIPLSRPKRIIVPVRTPAKPTSRAPVPRMQRIGRYLDPVVADRLTRSARIKNLSPEKLADQILGRHLPSVDELIKAESR
ncbi:MAG TPA: hypothetical protein VGM54_09905 [Chthoniobacter sp.]|jgi:hypothetical protein